MKTVYNARSNKNGIIFYSNTVSSLGIESYVDENGEIHSAIIPINIFLDDSYSNEFPFGKTLTKMQILLLDIALVLLTAFFSKSLTITLAMIFFALACSKKFFLFVANSMSLKIGKNKSTARFHAAEHMAINAYSKLERVPSLKEIKNYSPFCHRCDSRLVIFDIMHCIIIFISIACIGILHPIVCFFILISSFGLVPLLNKVGLLKFLQVFILSKPTDLELQVAIKGLEEFEKLEEKLATDAMCKIHYFSH